MEILHFSRQKNKTSSILIREILCTFVNQTRHSLFKKPLIEITMTVTLINRKKFIREIGKQKQYNYIYEIIKPERSYCRANHERAGARETS